MEQMPRKRTKTVQLNLFDVPSQDTEEKIMTEFSLYAEKLKEEGLWSYCETWWRSRFYDLIYPGHKKSKSEEEWKYRNKAQKAWPLIWKRFETEFILTKVVNQ